jgi:hypothetical protein
MLMTGRYELLTAVTLAATLTSTCVDSSSPVSPSTTRSAAGSLTTMSFAQSVTVGNTTTVTASGEFRDGQSDTVSASEQSSDISGVAVNTSSSVAITPVPESSSSSGSANPSVGVAMTRLKVSAADTSLTVGETTTVKAVAYYSDGSQEGVTPTWSSKDPAVATVSAAGQVTAVAVGTVRIQASHGGKNRQSGLLSAQSKQADDQTLHTPHRGLHSRNGV